MSGHHRDRQLLRQAEGYLELALAATAVDCPFEELPLSIRRQLADHCLSALDQLTPAMGARSHALMLRGQALKQSERFVDAITTLNQAAHVDPENIHILLALAWCHKRNGGIDLAIQSLEEALLADANEPVLYYNLACYWSLAGNVDLTVNYLAQAIDLDENLRELVANESDFDTVRHRAVFQTVTNAIV